MSNALVSLGVPVFNGERFLPQTLAALRDQDHTNLEIVISDNGSTDATEEICRAAMGEDDRIRYLRHEHNRGGAWNFNHVIERASGDYIKIAAADDLILPTFVSACLAELEELGPQWVAAFPRTRLIDADGATVEVLDDEDLHVDQDSPHERLRRYLHAKAGHVVYALMRADALRSTRGIRPVVIDDIVLMIEMACRGRFALVPQQLFLQRRHANQASAAGHDMVQWFSPGSNSRFAFPFTVAQVDATRAVLTSPLPRAEKARCLHVLTRTWVIPEWRAVASDVRRALRR